MGTVFTANLNANTTFNITNTFGNNAFTVILTNDTVAGRSVAFTATGGSVRFPGGASSLSRTTSVNNTDVWVFFTANQGNVWYGNLSFKNLRA